MALAHCSWLWFPLFLCYFYGSFLFIFQKPFQGSSPGACLTRYRPPDLGYTRSLLPFLMHHQYACILWKLVILLFRSITNIWGILVECSMTLLYENIARFIDKLWGKTHWKVWEYFGRLYTIASNTDSYPYYLKIFESTICFHIS